MPRPKGVKNGSRAKYQRCVQIAYDRGLLEQRGAKSELARILGVTRQYVNTIINDVKAEGPACVDTRGQNGYTG